jgi:hypothetical protein
VQAQLRDLALLFAGDGKLHSGVVAHALLNGGEHVGGTFPRCAQDEDAAELLLVGLVRGGEFRLGRGVCGLIGYAPQIVLDFSCCGRWSVE